MGKKVLVSVINDLVTDQRVKKVCGTISQLGFDITLVGRRLRNSPSMDERAYEVHRMNLLFEKGPLFYAEYNLRLFGFLLSNKADLLVSNDLDTLLPNFLASRIKRIPLVYDSHEYFTEVPELVNRPVVQKIWKSIERWIFPKLKQVFTVNDSIAGLFYKDYGIRPIVVRNIPPKSNHQILKTRKELGLPEDKYILILQGAGINVHRGSEEMVEAMPFIENTLLLIIGGGDVVSWLKKRVLELNLSDRVIFKPRMPYSELIHYTANANAGLTLDKDSNLNYRFSLPNKLFDYIQAGIPVISSPLPEIQKIIDTYQVGCYIPDHDPMNIAKKINEVLANQEQMKIWKKNCSFASLELNWEAEEKKVIDVYSHYV
ncbi:MAG: glycosyltransferase family 4 protein [Bacteroidales bacterium]|nr:glycosyltransferase family 4 protein [Bacteroidales bacterium]